MTWIYTIHKYYALSGYTKHDALFIAGMRIRIVYKTQHASLSHKHRTSSTLKQKTLKRVLYDV